MLTELLSRGLNLCGDCKEAICRGLKLKLEEMMAGLTPDDVDHLFSYHPPKGEADVEKYQRIRDAGRAMAHVILEETPSCPDQTVAIRKIREAVMTANAAVACSGRG